MEDDSECLHSLSFQGMLLLELKAKVDISWDCKEIKPANPKGNQSWIFTGRTITETPILWPPDVKRQLTGKDSDVGKDWRQKEKGAAEDETVNSITDRMHMNLNKLWEMRGRGQRSLASYSPQCSRESEAIYKLNNNKNNKRCIIRSRVARMGEPGV